VVPELDPYAVTYLAGGNQRTVEAAVLNLARVGVVEVSLEDGTVRRSTELPAGAHPVERAVYESLEADGYNLQSVVAHLAPRLRPLADALRRDGLAVPEGQALRVIGPPLALMLTVPTVGLFRILQGAEQGKPIEFISILTIVSLLVSLVTFAQRPLRSRKGHWALEQLRDRYQGLELTPHADLNSLSATALPFILGLFGTGCLAGTPLEATQRRLENSGSTPSTAGSCGGGCGGGCGGCG
jgi:uncharacterized protein (TIGR04222 family)